jgi:hypothetical protein
VRSPGVKAWKWVGLAGLAGVAATGVVVARAERERRSYTPDDVRARLHERAHVLLATGEQAVGEGPAAHRPAAFGADGGRARLERLRRVVLRWRTGRTAS